MLKKKYRLRKNKEFQAVYRRKDSVAAGAVVLYIKSNDRDGVPRVGFSVSKKLGNAVMRNRCRRRLREAVRLHLPALAPGKDYVFVGRQSLARSGFRQAERDILSALRRKGCLGEKT